MTKKIIAISFSIFLVCLTVKVFVNKFQNAQYPDLPKSISCLSYEPRSGGKQIGPDNLLTEEQIRSDLEIISKYSKCIHTYYMLYGMEEAPRIAKEFGIKLVAGIWISEDQERNKQEIEMAKKVLKENKNIFLVGVGNETQLFRKISATELLKYIREVKKFSPFPVSTDEFSLFWFDYPEVVKEVGYIAVHVFPYWTGANREASVSNVLSEYKRLTQRYPSKKVYLTETGWPTLGNKRWGAEPSLDNQRKFLLELDSKIKDLGGFYNVVETFDQPWKIHETEGRAGTHWGILDVNGVDKVEKRAQNLSFAGTIIILISLIVNSIFSIRYRRLKFRAHFLSHWFFALIITSTVWIILTLYEEYLLSSPLIWSILIPSQILLIFIAISHFIQGVRVYGDDPDLSLRPEKSKNLPFVSIHIPCRNENPEQVIACATSCLNQNYPSFEVIVVDNNTTDPSLWKPLKDFALKNKEGLKFIHVENLKGFKAGALNLALRNTSEKAVTIAVVDSDYVVSPEWLSSSVPYLSEKVKVVQSPQNYRTRTNSLFEKAVILEQKIFFEVGMKVRNTANAIIEHGTLCLIDKKSLEKVGGWAEWCITEDTELGLRMLFAGYQVLYIPDSFGGGIAPKSLFECVKQRFRWVYGSVRMTVYYFKDFIFGKRLSFKQKYYFVSGWLFWFAHIFYPLFVLGAFIGTFIVMEDERLFPPSELSFTLIIFVFLEIFLAFLLLKKITKSKILDIIGVILLGISLTGTITTAVLTGLIYKEKPFEVTSKNVVPQTWRQLFNKTVWSILLFLEYAMVTSLILSKYSTENRDVFIWVFVIFVLSIVPMSVIIVETMSFFQSRRKLV